jgi:peptide/nickel transport system permease protein
VVSALGLDLGLLLAGNAILTETVFNIPGIGRMSYNAIVNSDLPTIEGVVLFGALFIVVAEPDRGHRVRVHRSARAVFVTR